MYGISRPLYRYFVNKKTVFGGLFTFYRDIGQHAASLVTTLSYRRNLKNNVTPLVSLAYPVFPDTGSLQK